MEKPEHLVLKKRANYRTGCGVGVVCLFFLGLVVVVGYFTGAQPDELALPAVVLGIMGAVVVQLTYALSIGMIIESVLSFLGLGVQPPDASLGSLLRQGSAYLTIAPWLVLSSGVVLSAAIMSVNLVGDAVRDALEPLKGRSLT